MNRQLLKSFDSDEAAIEYGRCLLKQQTENVLVNGELVLLCGTSMVDDIVEARILDAADDITSILNGENISLDDVYDVGAHNILVEAYYDFLQAVFNQRVLYVYDEF